jgi:hypothetical protein
MILCQSFKLCCCVITACPSPALDIFVVASDTCCVKSGKAHYYTMGLFHWCLGVLSSV